MAEWSGRCTLVPPGMVNAKFFDEAKPDKLQPDDVASVGLNTLVAALHAPIRERHLMPSG